MKRKLLRRSLPAGVLFLALALAGVVTLRCVVGEGREASATQVVANFPARVEDTGRTPGPDLAAMMAGFARSDTVDAVAEYLQSGYSPNAANAAGDSLLILAAYNGASKVTELLLRDPRTVIDATGPRGFTALAGASFKGDAEIVRTLLAAGANPNASGASGRTPLMLAALTGRVGVIRVLLDAGADRSAKDAQGRDAAFVAETQGLEPESLLLKTPAPAPAAP